MPRLIKRLSPTELLSLKPGRHHDGSGLYLRVTGSGTRSWELRFMVNGQARYMGLGAFPDASLAQARRLAEEGRRQLRDGTDPIVDRQRRREVARLANNRSVTFEHCAKRYIEAHRAGWRNSKHAAQWSSSLATYAFPIFGNRPIQEITTQLVLDALEPIWRDKTETASRTRQRVEAVLDWATAHGLRTGDNPARWRGLLDKMLPRPTKVRAVKHHSAMPFVQVPKLITELNKRDTISTKALAFTILTATRSAEVRGATWDEFDLDEAIWTIPGLRTKSGRPHRVPLSSAAMFILHGLSDLRSDSGSIVFPNARGHALSDAAMRKYLQEDMGQVGLSVHGFRAAMRTWASERTNFPREVCEAALGHIVGDQTERAYARGDMLARRRQLMESWAEFCTTGNAETGRVVPIRADITLARPT